jgi:hypothetical protein
MSKDALIDSVEETPQCLENLPLDCVQEVFSFVDAPTIVNVGQTCHKMKELSDSPLIWRHLFLQNFNYSTFSQNPYLDVGEADCKSQYKKCYIERITHIEQVTSRRIHVEKVRNSLPKKEMLRLFFLFLNTLTLASFASSILLTFIFWFVKLDGGLQWSYWAVFAPFLSLLFLFFFSFCFTCVCWRAADLAPEYSIWHNQVYISKKKINSDISI